MKKIIKFEIPNYQDRANIIVALASSGYRTYADKEKRPSWQGGDRYFVLVEVENSLIFNPKSN
jgi:hypothetical protein